MPSENAAPSVDPHPDRRARKREARRDHLLDLAADLVDEVGVDGLTMAALADAADYATASLYTYFPSRSALLAALQRRALAVLAQVGDEAAATWDAALAERTVPAEVAALARLCAFSDLFLAAPVRHRREFRLQQQLLVTPGLEEAADAGEVVPAAMAVLDLPRRLLSEAASVGALRAEGGAIDPLGDPLEVALGRTFAWVLALNGALLADGLVTGLPATGALIGAQLTDALLLGWGADPTDLQAGRACAHAWKGA